MWRIDRKLTGRKGFDDMIDHHSYTHNLLKQLWNLSLKKHSGLNGIQTHDLRYQHSALPTELSSHLGAGHFVNS